MKRGKKRVIVIFLSICILLGTGLTLEVYGIERESRQNKKITVIAHRAGAAVAPENTLWALEQAIAQGADMAEIDIRQLKDGTLIVMHDNNFLRTTGVDKAVENTYYADLAQLDAGSLFQEQFAGEKVPTLEEMLDCARGRICLMIEVKLAGNEQNLEQQLVELIQRRGMEEQCIIGSMNREVLEKVKELDSRLDTVYIAHRLQEDDYQQKFIDSYSVETVNMTRDMVERIHAQDKPVYGWTANSRQAMQWIMDCGADGIITDNVALANSFLGKNRLYAVFTGWFSSVAF